MADKVLPDGGGLRFNAGKRRLDLMSPVALNGLADVLTKGVEKYAERNWERGMDWSKCYASLLRHLLAWQSGEDNDPETGLSHMDHAACNVHFLQHYIKTGTGKDDRPNSEYSVHVKAVAKACMPSTGYIVREEED